MRVSELWRYPVKGLRGESLERVEVAADGIPGDRGLRVVDERGIVTGRRKQRMIGLPATLGADGEALIDGHPWSSPEAAAAVREVAGAGAGLSRPFGGHEYDAAQILLLSDGSVDQLGYDRRRFRPNIYFEGAEGPVELSWIGRRVRVGELRPARRRALRAVRDHDHRPRHGQGRARGPDPRPGRARRQHGRLLHGDRAGQRSRLATGSTLV